MECVILRWLALCSFAFRGGEGLEEAGEGGGVVVGGEEVLALEVLQGAQALMPLPESKPHLRPKAAFFRVQF